MGKLMKHLKPHIISIIGIVLFLFIQAYCDLSLPDYMSHIVNVGIQQGGIENAVPDIIRKTEMDKITFLMNDDDKKNVLDNYVLIEKGKASQEDMDKYLKKYPEIKNNDVYKLNTSDNAVIDKINTAVGKPMIFVGAIEGSIKMPDTSSEKNSNTTGDSQMKKLFANVPKGTDPFTVIAKLPKEQLEEIMKTVNEKFEGMPDSIITQSATTYVKAEYNTLGRDTGSLQSNYILIAGLKMLFISLISMVATVIVGLIAARVSAGVGRSMRKNVFENVVGFSNAEFDKFSTSSLITRSTNDIQQVQIFLVMLLRIVFYAPILGIGGVLKVLKTDTSMTWVIGVGVLAIMILVAILFAVAMPKFKSMQKLVDRLNLVTRESLTGMLVIRAFGTQKTEEQKFEQANTNFTRNNLFVGRVMSAMFPAMMLLMNGVMILIVWVGAHQIDMGNMQVGNMMAFIQYAMLIIMAFLMISMVSIILPRASVSITRIGEVIDTKGSIKDPAASGNFVKEMKGNVEFKNVSFRYPGAEDDVISNVSFTAKPGQTTAFIGSTGSGKSTLINLIPRFYDVTEGQILIGGVDIRDVSQHDLRQKIGYVPQKGILFSGTIESNLKYGYESASEEDIRTAAEIAQAADFINEKEEGFKTDISQGGTNVSGGQKQRLSIARALVKKPEIFIFDDSFSALDFKTDAALRRALKEKIKGATILVVAQRISTVMTADQILVLDEGQVVGIGTHRELMETCDVYKQIALSQLSKEELA
ncbi:ABC transporter ATP-binding protein [Ruminiclostridium cellulolyticum]|uniref:ABC transporter related n=1 Tax=Ruminiclostridium cellulolyticum (strain ATCC 35319 / DSM 5812 / JCM 6584 / H10) TaxID=394503 RepID=B8I0H3_RUMCH|nr:ABC transporter ATP-binding protein [Ruminiclostridium cellulolyticum]ACL75548.1 ABC transporter related [Ruminiclostridium cellulolyticum H10]